MEHSEYQLLAPHRTEGTLTLSLKSCDHVQVKLSLSPEATQTGMGVTVAREGVLRPVGQEVWSWVFFALGLGFLIWISLCSCLSLPWAFVSCRWWLLIEYWGMAKWHPDPGCGDRTPPHSPGSNPRTVRGLSLCLQGQ